MMQIDDFERVEALFAELAGLEGAARAGALAVACPDRPDLATEVAALLAAHDRVEGTGSADDASADATEVGARLGPFLLTGRLGGGGMGDVYRAQRADGAFAQEVAVKVMRPGIAHANLLARFRTERQILASLAHPHIVRLLDGGAMPDGRAYLVTELVEGTDLLTHCRADTASLRERLQLFLTLCAAVHHAHQRGVVHRDIKPANVMVGADGILKVLDFGVAKLLEPQPGEAADTTRGALPGPMTPNYASPEQLRGLPVTTASDVYALGIVLYELVSGSRPYDTAGLTLDRVLEIVLHEDPPLPSVASSRRELRGDIDAIVMKALSKEPTARYGSAAELGADVERVLAGEPVLARPPSAAYVLGRMAARHKVAMAGGALALAAIVALSSLAWWQRSVALREQARAEQRFSEVRQLANAMIFKVHDAVAPLPGSTPVRRTIVSEALGYLERLEREAGRDDMTLRLELSAAYRQIGSILGDPQRPNLGDRKGAIAQFEKARAMLLPLLTDTAHADVFTGLVRVNTSLATLYQLNADSERAGRLAGEAVAQARRLHQRDTTNDQALATLGSAVFTQAWLAPPMESAAAWQEVLALYEQLLARNPDDPEQWGNIARVEKYLAPILPDREALPHYQRAATLDLRRLEAAPDDRSVQFDAAISLAGLGNAAWALGDLEAADRHLARSLTMRQRLVDTDPTDVRGQARLGYALARKARLDRVRGQLDSARRLAVQAVELLEPLYGRTTDVSAARELAMAWLEIAHVEARAGRRSASCTAFRRSQERFTEWGNPDQDRTLRAEVGQGLAGCR